MYCVMLYKIADFKSLEAKQKASRLLQKFPGVQNSVLIENPGKR